MQLKFNDTQLNTLINIHGFYIKYNLKPAAQQLYYMNLARKETHFLVYNSFYRSFDFDF